MSRHSSDQDDQNDNGMNGIQFESVLLSKENSQNIDLDFNRTQSSHTFDKSMLSYTENEDMNQSATGGAMGSGSCCGGAGKSVMPNRQSQHTPRRQIPDLLTASAADDEENDYIKSHPLFQRLLAECNTLKDIQQQKDQEIKQLKQHNVTLVNDVQVYRTKLQQAVGVIKDLKEKKVNLEKKTQQLQQEVDKLHTTNNNNNPFSPSSSLNNNNQQQIAPVPLDLPLSPITPRNNTPAYSTSGTDVLANLFDNTNLNTSNIPPIQEQQSQNNNNSNINTSLHNLSLHNTPVHHNNSQYSLQHPPLTPAMSSISTPGVGFHPNYKLFTTDQQIEHIQRLDQTLNALKDRYNNVKEKYRQLYTTHKSIKEENVELKKQLTQLDTDLKNLKQKIATTPTQTPTTIKSNTEFDLIIKSNEELIKQYQTKLQQYENTLFNLQQQNGENTLAMSALTQTVEQQKLKLTQYEQKITSLNNVQTQNQTLQQKINVLQQQYNDIVESSKNNNKNDDENNITITNLQQQITQYESEKAQLNQQIAELEQTNVINKADYNQLQQEYKKLQIKFEENQSNYNSLSSQHNTIKLTLQALEVEAKQAQARIDALQNEINTTTSTNNTTESVARELQTTVLENVKLTKKYEVLEKLYNTTLADFQNESEMLKTEYQNDMQRVEDEKAAYCKQVDEQLYHLSQQHQQDIARLNNIIAQKEQDIQQILQNDITQYQQQINELNQKIVNNEEHYHNIIIEKENYISQLSLQQHEKEVQYKNMFHEYEQKLEYWQLKCYEYEIQLVQNNVDGVVVSPNNHLIHQLDDEAFQQKMLQRQYNNNNQQQHQQNQQEQNQQDDDTTSQSNNNDNNNNATSTTTNNSTTSNNQQQHKPPQDDSTIIQQHQQAAMHRREENLLKQIHKQQMVRLLQKNAQLIQKIKLMQKYTFFLTKQIEIFITTKKRNLIDVDYLKNVLVRYIQFEKLGLRSEQNAMVPVIGTLLHFSKDDYKIISFEQNGPSSNSTSSSQTSSQWGSWLWGGGTNTPAPDANAGKSYSAATGHDFDATGLDPMSVLQSKTSIRTQILKQQQNGQSMDGMGDIGGGGNASSMQSSVFVTGRGRRALGQNAPSTNQQAKVDDDIEYVQAIGLFLRDGKSVMNKKLNNNNTEGQESNSNATSGTCTNNNNNNKSAPTLDNTTTAAAIADEVSPLDLNGNIASIKSLLPPQIEDRELLIDLEEFGLSKEDVFDDDDTLQDFLK